MAVGRRVGFNLARLAAAVMLGAVLAGAACSEDVTLPEAEVVTTPDVAEADAEAEAEAGVSSLTQDVEMSIELSSTTFNRIRRIPIEHACPSNKTNPNLGDIRDGGNLSPPLAWTGAPEGTVSLALVMEGKEPRADEPNVHWLVWNIPAEVTELPAGTPTTTLLASIGPRAAQGTNSFGRIGYDGPCPQPINLEGQDRTGGRDAVSRYHFRVYALDIELDLAAGATLEELLRAIDGHVLAGGEIVGERVGEYFRRIIGS